MTDYALHPLLVQAVQQQENTESPVLVMEDDEGRILQIPIGVCEGIAIQKVLDGQKAERPQSHDLLLLIAEQLSATFTRVLIDDVSGDTFYARILMRTEEGEVSLDCRPSDGVAVALRAKIPVLATAEVMHAQEE